MNPREIPVTLNTGAATTAIIYPAVTKLHKPAAFILAHGAGAPQRHPFMLTFARGLSSRGLDIVTFNFVYMEQKRKMPDRMPQLVACYNAVIDAAREELPSAHDRLFIGGKSMGGRAATHVAAESDADRSIRGVVLLGYPLHPPGRPDQLRDAHLPDVKLPMLFIQGSRDTFGTPAELKPILARLTPPPTLHSVDGGDHSVKLSGKTSDSQAALYDELCDLIIDWIAQNPRT